LSLAEIFEAAVLSGAKLSRLGLSDDDGVLEDGLMGDDRPSELSNDAFEGGPYVVIEQSDLKLPKCDAFIESDLRVASFEDDPAMVEAFGTSMSEKGSGFRAGAESALGSLLLPSFCTRESTSPNLVAKRYRDLWTSPSAGLRCGRRLRAD
jgi:hypothetical protein